MAGATCTGGDTHGVTRGEVGGLGYGGGPAGCCPHLAQPGPVIGGALSAPQAGGHEPEAEVDELGLWEEEEEEGENLRTQGGGTNLPPIPTLGPSRGFKPGPPGQPAAPFWGFKPWGRLFCSSEGVLRGGSTKTLPQGGGPWWQRPGEALPPSPARIPPSSSSLPPSTWQGRRVQPFERPRGCPWHAEGGVQGARVGSGGLTEWRRRPVGRDGPAPGCPRPSRAARA